MKCLYIILFLTLNLSLARVTSNQPFPQSSFGGKRTLIEREFTRLTQDKAHYGPRNDKKSEQRRWHEFTGPNISRAMSTPQPETSELTTTQHVEHIGRQVHDSVTSQSAGGSDVSCVWSLPYFLSSTNNRKDMFKDPGSAERQSPSPYPHYASVSERIGLGSCRLRRFFLKPVWRSRGNPFRACHDWLSVFLQNAVTLWFYPDDDQKRKDMVMATLQA